MKEKKSLKGFFNTLKTIGRGVIKAVPIGNVLVEAVQNKKAVIAAKDENGNPVPVDKPHSILSMVVQVIIVLAIGWAFYTEKISVHQLINLLLSFIGL